MGIPVAAHEVEAKPPATETIRLWDPFVRLFHWTLTLCVVAAWVLGEAGPADMSLHFYLGYAILGLLAMRAVWGFVGPRTARFSSYFYSPGQIIDYLRHVGARRPSNWRGHNPVGGLYVLALLVVVGCLATAGLFADPQDYINTGPLASKVSAETSMRALFWHGVLAKLVLAMVTFHVAAIVYYQWWKRDDLIHPMITGLKVVPLDPLKRDGES